MTRRILAAIATAALAVGSPACSKADDQLAKTGALPGASEAGSSQPAKALVPLADLRALVPEFPGWTRGEIAAQEAPAPEASAHVVVTFSRGIEEMDLEIADTGGAARAIASLEAIAGSSTNRTVGNGYFKGIKVGSFPAVESWNTVDKLGEVSVLVRRRFIIHVSDSGLRDAAPMRALAEAVDVSRLR